MNFPELLQSRLALFQGTEGQGDISGDHDVLSAGVPGNPIIGGVETAIHDNNFEPTFRRCGHPGVRNQDDYEAVPLRPAIDFLLHRTPISIDKDV